MPDVILTIDGRDYEVSGNDNPTYGDLEGYADKIRTSPLHQGYLADLQKQQTDLAEERARLPHISAAQEQEPNIFQKGLNLASKVAGYPKGVVTELSRQFLNTAHNADYSDLPTGDADYNKKLDAQNFFSRVWQESGGGTAHANSPMTQQALADNSREQLGAFSAIPRIVGEAAADPVTYAAAGASTISPLLSRAAGLGFGAMSAAPILADPINSFKTDPIGSAIGLGLGGLGVVHGLGHVPGLIAEARLRNEINNAPFRNHVFPGETEYFDGNEWQTIPHPAPPTEYWDGSAWRTGAPSPGGATRTTSPYGLSPTVDNALGSDVSTPRSLGSGAPLEGLQHGEPSPPLSTESQTPPSLTDRGYPIHDVLNQIGEQGGDEYKYASLIDAYRQVKKDNPSLTKQQFADAYFNEIRGLQGEGVRKYEMQGPAGNIRERDVFTATDANGIPRRMAGMIQHPQFEDSPRYAHEERSAGIPSEINDNQSQPSQPTAPPFTDASLDAALENGVVHTASDSLLGKARQVQDALHNYFQENLTGLKRESRPVYNSAVKLAATPSQAAAFTSDTLPSVLEGLSPDDVKRFQLYGVADSTDGHVARTGERTPEQAYQPNGGRLLDPVTEQPITAKMLDEFYSKPAVMEAIARWKQNVEPMLTKNFESGGLEAVGDRGRRSGAFFPKLALDENGLPHGYSGETGSNLRVGEAPGAKAFTGKAHDYEPDVYTAVYNRVLSGTKYSNKLELVKSLLDSGTAIDPKNVENKPTGKINRFSGGIETHPLVPFNGSLEPGYRFKLTDHFNDAVLKRVGLPKELYVPKRFADEINSVFAANKASEAGEFISRIHQGLVKTAIFGPGEAAAHAGSLGSRLENARAMLPDYSAFRSFKRGVTKLQGYLNFKDIVDAKYTPEEHAETVRLLAETGRLPERYGIRPTEEPPTGIAKVADTFDNFLNGKDGIVVKTAIKMYQYVDALPGGASAHDELLRQMFRELNTSVSTLKPTLARSLSKWNMGDFYQTGVKNRTSLIHAGVGKFIAAIAGGALSSILLYKATSGKWPTEDPDYKWGDVALPFIHDTNGGHYVINTNFGDKTLGYAQKLIGDVVESIAKKKTPLNTAETIAAGQANQLVNPIFSGPLSTGVGALTGISPHISPGDNLNFPNVVVRNNASQFSPFDVRRLTGAAQSLLPISQIGGNTTDNALSTEGVDNLGAKIANVPLRLLGLPAIRKERLAYDVLEQERKKEAAHSR